VSQVNPAETSHELSFVHEFEQAPATQRYPVVHGDEACTQVPELLQVDESTALKSVEQVAVAQDSPVCF